MKYGDSASKNKKPRKPAAGRRAGIGGRGKGRGTSARGRKSKARGGKTRGMKR